jgi:hypothetical protein
VLKKLALTGRAEQVAEIVDCDEEKRAQLSSFPAKSRDHSVALRNDAEKQVCRLSKCQKLM